MTLIYEQRASDSPLIDTIMQGHTLAAATTIRPAEINWHMVISRFQGTTRFLVVGPWAEAGNAAWGADADILWIRFKPGIFMPHLPTRQFLDTELALPEAAGRSFWLHSTAREIPTYENVETFVNRLIREDVLVKDTVVDAALNYEPLDLASRTIRDRFLRSTGLTYNHIRQVERAQRAAALLGSGTSILDTVFEAGYFDQPHLTRSLKRFIGYTPSQLIRLNQAENEPANRKVAHLDLEQMSQ